MPNPRMFRVDVGDHPYCPPGWLWLFIYDDVEDMRADAKAYSPGLDWSDGVGVFQSPSFSAFFTKKWRVKKGKTGPEFAGVMRLVRGHIGPEEVAHESTHAALAIYCRQVRGFVEIIKADIPRDEEPLCYLVGAITAKVADVLHEHDLWDDKDAPLADIPLAPAPVVVEAPRPKPGPRPPTRPVKEDAYEDPAAFRRYCEPCRIVGRGHPGTPHTVQGGRFPDPDHFCACACDAFDGVGALPRAVFASWAERRIMAPSQRTALDAWLEANPPSMLAPLARGIVPE